MKRMTMALLYLAISGGISLHAQEEKVDGMAQLARLQLTYEREMTRITTNAVSRRASLDQQYSKAITGYATAAQEVGNLDALLQYRTELERFERDRVVAERHLADAKQGDAAMRILKLQTGYRTALKRINSEEAAEVLGLTEKYDGRLRSLQSALTRAGDLEGALAVKDERDALETRSEVSAARFVQAEAEAAAQRHAADDMAGAGPGVVPPEAPPEPEVSPEEAKRRIQKRFAEFATVVEAGEMDKVVAFVEPDFVRRFGTEAVKNTMRIYTALLRVGRQVGRPVRTEKAEIDLTDDRAALHPMIWDRDHWRAADRAVHWVLVEGEWYVDPATQRDEEQRNRAARQPDRGAEWPRRPKYKEWESGVE